MSGIGSALIGAGASLLGGIFGGSKQKWVTPDYQRVRANAEAAGFNPLFALSSNAGQAVQSQNYMGAAISDAGMYLADAVAKREDAQKLSRAEDDNRKLREKIQSLTIRPKFGGIYSQQVVTPTIREAVGGGDDENVSDHPSGGVAVPDPTVDRGNSPYVGGIVWESAPGWAPSEVIETEYAELVSIPYGIGKLTADMGWNVAGLINDRGMKYPSTRGGEMSPPERPSFAMTPPPNPEPPAFRCLVGRELWGGSEGICPRPAALAPEKRLRRQRRSERQAVSAVTARKPCAACAKRREALRLAAKKLIIKIKPKGKTHER